MFQDNLKTLRRNKGITQEELAARLNVVRQTVSKWEKGQSVPDAEMLMKLAEVFEVPVSQLLGSRIEQDEQPDAIAAVIVGAVLLQLLAVGVIILLRAVPQNGSAEITEWTEIIEK